MYIYGGVYADLDVICLKPFEALIDSERRARLPVGGAGSLHRAGPSEHPAHAAGAQRRHGAGQDAEPVAILGMMGTDFAFMHNMPNGVLPRPCPHSSYSGTAQQCQVSA
jgi:hypothetical protein